jgi:hypothetical protein
MVDFISLSLCLKGLLFLLTPLIKLLSGDHAITWCKWQLHCICAHTPHALIGFMHLPHALHAHDQGTHSPLLHYHHVDTVSISFLVQDLCAITIPFTFNLLELLYSALGSFTSISAYEGMHVCYE